jgi:hypothetical protein
LFGFPTWHLLLNTVVQLNLFLGEQIRELDVGEPLVSSRLAVLLIQALEDAADYHQLGANLQVETTTNWGPASR